MYTQYVCPSGTGETAELSCWYFTAKFTMKLIRFDIEWLYEHVYISYDVDPLI